MNHLLIGAGEVGRALAEVLRIPRRYWQDPMCGFYADMWIRYDFAHVCIPFNGRFHQSMVSIREVFKAAHFVIHSSVPVGTSRKHGCLHSPVRGVHPNLALGLRTFTKYIGGIDGAFDLAEVYRDAGITPRLVESQETTEALKLWDTTQYGLMIAVEKEIHRYCIEHHLDFDVLYSEANRSYNAGYQELNREDVMRPHLKHVDGPIGGHCILPNAELLDSWIARLILKLNGEYEENSRDSGDTLNKEVSA